MVMYHAMAYVLLARDVSMCPVYHVTQSVRVYLIHHCLSTRPNVYFALPNI
jgi:hypothetical protein